MKIVLITDLVSIIIAEAFDWKEIILRGVFQTSHLMPTVMQILLVPILLQTRKLFEVLARSAVQQYNNLYHTESSLLGLG
jgi:hypothetical protein